jgi:hypothetical protein
MATIKSTDTTLTVTMDIAEFIRVVGGYVSPCLRTSLPKYEGRFARCESLKVHAEGVKVVIQMTDKCDIIQK